ncbi:transketolase [Georgenia yuyongxinii]|uniref:transketolase n=1 Tax=Georgenia yuyongxinii TaxID=2589797 RepID=A0A5B8C5I4_9MICO|nr:transketolase [Georgenia yuyongxinii]QDC25618.1 transketolase [Georgenia yuyongxinii]
MLAEPTTISLHPHHCSDVEALSVNTARMLAMDQVAIAKSGHYGFPLGAGAIVHTLFAHHLRFNPEDPAWLNRDRFVLSAGHGSAMLYAALHLAGYDLSVEDLRDFRQWGSKTPGHPERGDTPGVEVTTGPLGQGVANAVGLAIAEEYLRSRLGPNVVDHRTWVLASDGDLMEGIAYEAAAIAGKLELSHLCVVYDDNDVVIDSRASETMDSDGIVEAFRALGWHVVDAVDGMDVGGLSRAFTEAAAESQRPTLVRVRTTIGAGSPLTDDRLSHSGAPSAADLAATRAHLGLDGYAPFEVPAEVAQFWAAVREGNKAVYDAWETRTACAGGAESLLSPEEMVAACVEVLEVLEAPAGAEATRASSGAVLDAIAPYAPFLLGGSADLAGATFARLSDGGVFGPAERAGQNIRFGVREHAMGAIANGITMHSVLRGFGGTFLMFATYQANALRMAALQECPSIHIFSHDSVLLGEDGPTHQPVEVLPFLRSIPHMQVLRPADFYETKVAWKLALQEQNRPTCLVLSRSDLPQLDHSVQVGSAEDGAYLLVPVEDPEVVLIATGSETHLAVEAARTCGRRAAVVSVLDVERFSTLPTEALERLAPAAVPRVVVEAAHPMSWYRVLRPTDRCVGVTDFGASAPAEVIAERYGFTVEHLTDVVDEVLRG